MIVKSSLKLKWYLQRNLILHVQGLPVPGNWILATGNWNDAGTWDDSAVWNDN